jgi:LytS/YehU family sensor histidine kinase
VSPRLHGGRVTVRCTVRPDGGARVEVADDGPGLPPDPAPVAACVGLSNTRARLAQAFGERARLQLANAPEGGCVATVDLPPSDTPLVPSLP